MGALDLAALRARADLRVDRRADRRHRHAEHGVARPAGGLTPLARMSDHVALVYGFWGQNIGNAFFNLGGRRVLEEALGATRLKLIQDQPAYWTFHDERKGNYPNTLPLLAELEVETVVVQGPVLTPRLGEIWRPTLTSLRKHGMAWGGIGIGLRKYSPSERSSVAEVLREVPPRFLSTPRQRHVRLPQIARPARLRAAQRNRLGVLLPVGL